MTPRQREAKSLHFQGFTYKEIAVKMGIQEQSVMDLIAGANRAARGEWAIEEETALKKEFAKMCKALGKPPSQTLLKLNQINRDAINDKRKKARKIRMSKR